MNFLRKARLLKIPTNIQLRSYAASRKEARFPGAPNSEFTEVFKIEREWPTIPTFRILDSEGKVINKAEEPAIPSETLTKIYESMATLNIMDLIMYEAQRQGRISFYMTSFGEEGTIVASAAALTNDDVFFGQYREAGVLLWRGFTLDEFMNQMYSNEKDYGKGRQMPVHYGSKKLNFQTISSPLGTQIPQATGAGYALKREGKHACAVCFFGDGAASEGDFHAALNMAATTESPVIFVCRNNGFAISTSTEDQYRGDGIAARGNGYGVSTIRVDGNDALAVFKAVTEAKKVAVEENSPVLIEAMTYRIGHHSTSDDSSAYRSKDEVKDWENNDSPLTRLRKYLESKQLWDSVKEKEFHDKTRKQILTAFSKAEKLQKPNIDEMFTDVYDVLPPHLIKQQDELRRIIKEHPDHFSTLDAHAK